MRFFLVTISVFFFKHIQHKYIDITLEAYSKFLSNPAFLALLNDLGAMNFDAFGGIAVGHVISGLTPCNRPTLKHIFGSGMSLDLGNKNRNRQSGSQMFLEHLEYITIRDETKRLPR